MTTRASRMSARPTMRARSRVDGRARRRCVARGTRRDEDGTPTRVCVVGGGFAGASLAFHVIEEANARGRAIDVTLVDAVGVAGGASGVAAGLLHPYTPRGKTVWRGDEGVREAKRMIDAAQRAEEGLDVTGVERCDDADGGWRDSVGRNTGERRRERVANAPGIVRPARSAKQGRDFKRHVEADDAFARCLTTEETVAMCPGLAFTEDVLEEEREGDEGCAGALYIPNGVIVDAPRYLSALWDASVVLASRGAAGTRARLRISKVERVEDLFEEFDQVALCCGAAVASLFDYEKIPIQLQGGHVLELKPKEGLDVGILGTTYVAPLGTARAMVGPTKEYAAAPEDCFRAGVVDADADPRAADARAQLRELGVKAYPPTADWDVLRVKYGVRGNPPRTPLGALPLAGSARIDDETSAWFLAGLGARGLVYHGILGRWMANAILDDDVSRIPEDVRRVC